MSLKTLLKQKIKAEGSLSVADFMALVLSHPEYGYYMTRDPFGAQGDFTTASEISQMFGEMIGAWVADIWMQMGSPEKFTLLECGPGRGTLMADMMRAVANVPGFNQACEVSLMEISPVLKKMQADTLRGHNPTWVASLDDVKRDCPLIVVANEFLDALPVHQYVHSGDGWAERCVAWDEEQSFFMIEKSVIPAPSIMADAQVVEVSPAQSTFIKQLSVVLHKLGGAGLFIDYGYEQGRGDTLQALYKHKPCDVLEHIGQADITAHVNFGALRDIMPSQLTTQGQFLKNLGIEYRAEVLAQKTNLQDIQNALHRLIHDDEMGFLFKVMGVTHDKTLKLAGF